MTKKETKKDKILLVEDDEYISKAYNDGLTDAGFEVMLADDGKKGLKKIKEERPDLVLLDIVMPVMDGFEVLKKMKADDELKDIPVIILSNLAQGQDIEKGKELGAVDYLIKTEFWMEEVIKKIKSYID